MKKNNPHDYDFLIGKDTHTGEDIWLNPKDFALGGYFLGMRRVNETRSTSDDTRS
jgi:hypothetical protein